ncbi:MAG: Hpt domain-containing protein [Gemmatimonadetes bacterium]|nr:Hpt domain-containing protein [Gemmatimonadota bacterium]
MTKDRDPEPAGATPPSGLEEEAPRAPQTSLPVAAGTPSASPNPLDPRVIAEIMDLDRSGALLRTAFGMFLDDGPRLLGELQAAAHVQDRDAFAFAAHTLKSCAGSVGATRVAAASGSLEHAARQGATLGPASAIQDLERHLGEALQAMAAESGLPPAPVREDGG